MKIYLKIQDVFYAFLTLKNGCFDGRLSLFGQKICVY